MWSYSTTKKSSSSSSTTPVTTGNLCHITEDCFEDAVETDAKDDCYDAVPSNNNNEATLIYFARMSNHYLRLGKASSLIAI